MSYLWSIKKRFFMYAFRNGPKRSPWLRKINKKECGFLCGHLFSFWKKKNGYLISTKVRQKSICFEYLLLKIGKKRKKNNNFRFFSKDRASWKKCSVNPTILHGIQLFIYRVKGTNLGNPESVHNYKVLVPSINKDKKTTSYSPILCEKKVVSHLCKSTN